MRRLAPAVVVLSLGCASCGGVSTPSVHSVRSQLEQDVAKAVLGRAGYRQARQEVDRLMHLCRAGSKDGRTFKQALADAASKLRPSQPKLAADLDRALRDGCK